MKKIWPVAITIIITVIILFWLKEKYNKEKVTDVFSFSAKPDTFTVNNTGDPVPGFTITTIDGQEIDMEKLKGKVVLLNFFATWCNPCMVEMPSLQKKIWERFKDDDFFLLALGREHTVEEMKEFVKVKGFTFPVAADTGRAVFKKFAVQNIPRNVIVDKNGNIVYQSVGYTKEEFMRMVDLIAKRISE